MDTTKRRPPERTYDTCRLPDGVLNNSDVQTVTPLGSFSMDHCGWHPSVFSAPGFALAGPDFLFLGF